MNRKHLLIISTLVIGLGFFALQDAKAGRGWGGGFGPGNCDGPRGNSQITEEQWQARQDFMVATGDLRKQLFTKKHEYRELMSQENVDKEAASQLWSQIFDLKAQLKAQADEAGIEGGFGNKKEFRGGYGRGNCGGPVGGAGNCSNAALENCSGSDCIGAGQL